MKYNIAKTKNTIIIESIPHKYFHVSNKVLRSDFKNTCHQPILLVINNAQVTHGLDEIIENAKGAISTQPICFLKSIYYDEINKEICDTIDSYFERYIITTELINYVNDDWTTKSIDNIYYPKLSKKNK